MNAARDSYSNATIILRPARIAILFRGDDHWRAWARAAIAVAGKYWGGAGFIIVPYSPEGVVSQQMLEIVAAYDPDHIVLVPMSHHEWERIAPGVVALRGEGGRLVEDPAERSSLLAELVGVPDVDRAGVGARASVAAVCTPLHNDYGTTDGFEGETLERLSYEPSRSGGWLAPAERGTLDSVVLATSETWTSDAALSLAIGVGVIPRDMDRTRPEPDAALALEAALDPDKRGRALREKLKGDLNVGSSWEGASRVWFDEPDGGLTSMRHLWGPSAGAIVIGDTAEDFALAYAYQRLLGYGTWLTTSMLADASLMRGVQVSAALAGISSYAQRQGEDISITSSSLELRALEDATRRLEEETWDTNPFAAAGSQEIHRTKRLPEGLKIGAPTLKKGLSGLAVGDPFALQISVPVEVGQDGTTTMRAPLPTPLPAKPMGVDGRTWPYWYVEVDLPEAAMPKTRGLRERLFAADRQHYLNQGVRSGRMGLVFHSQAGGVISTGTSLTAQVSKPRLRTLGMQTWVQSMVSKAGMNAVPSLPGRHAQLLARRLGGRDELMAMVAGNFRPALKAFATLDANRSTVRTDRVFPDGDGVVLDKERSYLTFQAFFRILPGIRRDNLRAWIDRLTQADLLRRGFILDCIDCSRPSFVSLDKTGQLFECVRCGAVNELRAERWKKVSDNPEFYFDLHASFRELMATNGDVSLIAAQRLRQPVWEYADTAELEFSDAGTGKRIAEIDLIANVDGEVVLVEAKSSGRLGSTANAARSAAKKKVTIAKALRADRIIVATTADALTANALELLREAAQAEHLWALQVEELTRLSHDQIDPPAPAADDAEIWQPT